MSAVPPIVVSVSGHRRLRDEDKAELTRVCKGLFSLLEKEGGPTKEDLERLSTSQGKSEGTYSGTLKENCICLSALATGADTLAANAALEMGWRVIAPLPLPLEEYRRDFEGPELEDELKHFDALLKRCPHFFVGYAPGCTPKNTHEYGYFRDLQYAYMGEYLTRHCDTLLAFWDGEPAGGTGGTADVVVMQYKGLPVNCLGLRSEGLLDAPEGGRVLHIWTPQKPKTDSLAKTVTSAIPSVSTVKTPKPPGAVVEIDLPIKASGQTESHRQQRRENWRDFLTACQDLEVEDPYNQLPLPTEKVAQQARLEHIRTAFLQADHLASKYQKEVNAWFHAIIAIAFTFTVCVGLAGAIDGGLWGTVALVASWAFLGSSWFLTRLEHKRGHQNRYQDYRALSEAWRVCYFWRMAGIDDALDTAYLRYQRGELDWIRQVLRTSDLQWRFPSTPLSDANPTQTFPTGGLSKDRATEGDFLEKKAGLIRSTYHDWVKGQTEYFAGKFPLDRLRLTRLRNWSWMALAVGLSASAVAAISQVTSASAPGSQSFGEGIWEFIRTFASADLLSSPFVPAALLLIRMEEWPLATESNTRDTSGETPGETRGRRILRERFNRQHALWRLMFVFLAIAASALGTLFFLSGTATQRFTPAFQVVSTVCFFLPSLIFLYADFKALPEHVTRYEKMYAIYERANEMLKEIGGKDSCSRVEDWELSETEKREAEESEAAKSESEEAKPKQSNRQDNALRVFRDLGREALHENGEWLLLHRDRPLDIEA